METNVVNIISLSDDRNLYYDFVQSLKDSSIGVDCADFVHSTGERSSDDIDVFASGFAKFTEEKEQKSSDEKHDDDVTLPADDTVTALITVRNKYFTAHVSLTSEPISELSNGIILISDKTPSIEALSSISSILSPTLDYRAIVCSEPLHEDARRWCTENYVAIFIADESDEEDKIEDIPAPSKDKIQGSRPLLCDAEEEFEEEKYDGDDDKESKESESKIGSTDVYEYGYKGLLYSMSQQMWENSGNEFDCAMKLFMSGVCRERDRMEHQKVKESSIDEEKEEDAEKDASKGSYKGKTGEDVKEDKKKSDDGAIDEMDGCSLIGEDGPLDILGDMAMLNELMSATKKIRAEMKKCTDQDERNRRAEIIGKALLQLFGEDEDMLDELQGMEIGDLDSAELKDGPKK
ncbi:hypothetical protein ADUPG1_008576 [Aduncisulcus paluster]|uniref:Alpha-and gamma-adaptin-binding protein p34 n=1 Tax=Aduncisulcus paluster TaxID=2918883 RepID=A0ABQ5KSG7_9EUKA|nr:hypothetical protein ADUPG1_008576 [Aduncisulcus paluster]